MFFRIRPATAVVVECVLIAVFVSFLFGSRLYPSVSIATAVGVLSAASFVGGLLFLGLDHAFENRQGVAGIVAEVGYLLTPTLCLWFSCYFLYANDAQWYFYGLSSGVIPAFILSHWLYEWCYRRWASTRTDLE